MTINVQPRVNFGLLKMMRAWLVQILLTIRFQLLCVLVLAQQQLNVFVLLLNLVTKIVEPEIYVKLMPIVFASLSLPIQIEALNVLLSLELALGTLNVLALL